MSFAKFTLNIQMSVSDANYYHEEEHSSCSFCSSSAQHDTNFKNDTLQFSWKKSEYDLSVYEINTTFT